MEDDPVLGDIIISYLEEFYQTNRAFDSNQALELIYENSYDLFIFDINVPGLSGVKLLKELRSFNNTTPTIIITAYTDTKYLKDSFESGAHDYIKKPFHLEELKLRIEKSRVIFNIEQDKTINISNSITYYPSQHLVFDGVKNISLSPKEIAILDYFIGNPRRIISKNELIQNLWTFDEIPTDATLRSYIRKLRAILGPEKITTQRGIGYRYE
jgi:DNA-binding response OmpR family regulator